MGSKFTELKPVNSLITESLNLIEGWERVQEPQLRAKVASEKLELDNNKIFKELAPENDHQNTKFCADCKKTGELKRCAFCGCSNCSRCMWKKRKEPSGPAERRFMPICRLCDLEFIRKKIFDEFYQKFEENEKEIEAVQALKEEEQSRYDIAAKELDSTVRQHQATLAEKEATIRTVEERNSVLLQDLEGEKEKSKKIEEDENDNKKLLVDLPQRIVDVDSEIKRNKLKREELTREEEKRGEIEKQLRERIDSMIRSICQSKKIDLSEKDPGSEVKAISQKEAALQRKSLENHGSLKCQIF